MTVTLANIRATMDDYLEALTTRGDFAVYFTDDVTFELIGTAQVIRGRSPVEDFIRYAHETAFDSSVEVQDGHLRPGRQPLCARACLQRAAHRRLHRHTRDRARGSRAVLRVLRVDRRWHFGRACVRRPTGADQRVDGLASWLRSIDTGWTAGAAPAGRSTLHEEKR